MSRDVVGTAVPVTHIALRASVTSTEAFALAEARSSCEGPEKNGRVRYEVAEGLAAVALRLESTQAARICAEAAQVLAQEKDGRNGSSLAAVAERLEPAEAARVCMKPLGNRYGRRFGTHWDFVRYAHEQNLNLDFTTPPQRPVAKLPPLFEP